MSGTWNTNWTFWRLDVFTHRAGSPKRRIRNIPVIDLDWTKRGFGPHWGVFFGTRLNADHWKWVTLLPSLFSLCWLFWPMSLLLWTDRPKNWSIDPDKCPGSCRPMGYKLVSWSDANEIDTDAFLGRAPAIQQSEPHAWLRSLLKPLVVRTPLTISTASWPWHWW